MSKLVPHIPNPTFWKTYYTDQAKGKMYARATPSHRTVGQRGGGKRVLAPPVVKMISPVQQTYDRAQSQIKRRLDEVGGANTKRRKIKGKVKGKRAIRPKDKRTVKKSNKKKPNVKRRKT
jgi:hypothetical protein